MNTMAQIVHIHLKATAPPISAALPFHLIRSDLRFQTWVYWNACQRAKEGAPTAFDCLRSVMRECISLNLSCAAGGALVSLDPGYAARQQGGAGS